MAAKRKKMPTDLNQRARAIETLIEAGCGPSLDEATQIVLRKAFLDSVWESRGSN